MNTNDEKLIRAAGVAVEQKNLGLARELLEAAGYYVVTLPGGVSLRDETSGLSDLDQKHVILPTINATIVERHQLKTIDQSILLNVQELNRQLDRIEERNRGPGT